LLEQQKYICGFFCAADISVANKSSTPKKQQKKPPETGGSFFDAYLLSGIREFA
jgi:hypothetical protein